MISGVGSTIEHLRIDVEDVTDVRRKQEVYLHVRGSKI